MHQLRYLAAYGGDTGAALGAQGHSYLAVVMPLLVILVASAVLGTLVAAAVASAQAPRRRTAGWLFCAAALIAVFVAQETVEGMLAAAHPAGVAGVLGHGGWIAVPIALAVGRVVSYLLGGLDAVEHMLGRREIASRRRAPSALTPGATAALAPLAGRPLAFGLARRPPPAPAA